MPSRRVAFSLAALVALAATLGLKALVSDFRGVPDFARFDAALTTVLERQGFVVTADVRPFDQTVLIARREGCLIAVRGEVRGDYNVGFRRQTGSLGPLVYSYSYRGRLRPDFPVTAFEVSNYLDRVVTRLGIPRATPAPIAIGALPGCKVDRIDFGPATIGTKD